MKRVGLIARCDSGGLARQGREFFHHMKPEATLVVRMNDLARYDEDPSFYSSLPHRIVDFDGHVGARFPEPDLDWFLANTDVIFTIETFYDERIPDMARDRNVRTVCDTNFELNAWATFPTRPRPTLFISPSTWHLGEYPQPVIHFPYPVDIDALTPRLRTSARHFTHIGGHPARDDRNGTRIILDAIPHIASPITLTIRAQTGWNPSPGPPPHHIDLRMPIGSVADYTTMYEDADVMVLPRRYGGRALGVMESLASGIPVIMPAISPNIDLLPAEMLYPCTFPPEPTHMLGGWIDVYPSDPKVVARKIDEFATNSRLVEQMSQWALEWGKRNSWEARKGALRGVLESA